MSFKTIYQYDDYRLFLRDRLKDLRSNDKALTVRQIAMDAGFGSSSYLNMIVKGERNLSQDSLKKVTDFLKLKPEETTFFRNLVGFNQASNPAEKNIFSQLLVKSKSFRREQPLAEVQFRFFAHWYYSPIFEILGFKSIGSTSIDHIKRHFEAEPSREEVQLALEDMEKLGLVEKFPNNTWRRLKESVVTGNDITSSFIVTYHREMIRRAEQALNDVSWDLRSIQTLTFSCKRKDVDHLRELVQQFHDQIVNGFSDVSDSDVVYQFNMQLFPLTKI